MSDEQPRDEKGRFISGLFSANQARAASTRRISEGLEKIANDIQAAKDKQAQQLSPEQEKLARGEFLRTLLAGGEDNTNTDAKES